MRLPFQPFFFFLLACSVVDLASFVIVVVVVVVGDSERLKTGISWKLFRQIHSLHCQKRQSRLCCVSAS